MLRSLVRGKFVDRIWGPEDLDQVAEFWLRLFDAADHPPGESWETHQRLELHLTGFTRSATQAFSEELYRRFSESGVPVEVAAADPDTLVAKTKPREGNRPPVRGLGVGDLAGAPFDGLVVEIRFTVADTAATEPAPGRVGATLVIVGELRAGTVLVRAVWSSAPFRPDAGAWDAPKGSEARLLPAFDLYRRGGKIRRWSATRFFNQSEVKSVDKSIYRIYNKLVDVPFGRPRLGGLCSRVVLLVVAPVVAAVSFGQYVDRVGNPVGLEQIVAILVGWCGTGFLFCMREYDRLFTDFTRYRAWYGRRFRDDDRYAVLPSDERRAWFDNPTVRKLTAEVVEAGFVHVADLTAISGAVGTSTERVFSAPDRRTYLFLFFAFETEPGPERCELWPARFSALYRTYCSPDGRCDTVNFVSLLHRLGRAEPDARVSVHPPGTHPLALYQAHADHLKQLSAETGVSYFPQEPLDRCLARYERVHKQRRKLYKQRPYSWRDQWRWYLQLGTRPNNVSL